MEIDLPAVDAPRRKHLPPQATSLKAQNDSALFGLVGVAGAALLFAGDMLLYGHAGSGDGFLRRLPTVASGKSPGRLFAGGALGPIGAVLIAAGFWHVFLEVRSAFRRGSRVLFAGFAFMSAGAAAFHATWTVRMLLYRFSITPDALTPAQMSLGLYMGLLFAITAVPGYVASGVLLAAVLSGRTRYPRWSAPINPGVLALFSGVTIWAPAPWGAPLRGGFLSLMLLVFFVTSVLLTRPRQRARWVEDEIPGAR